MLVNEHHSNCPRVIAENGELRRRRNGLEGKILEAASSAEQFQATFSVMNEEEDDLAAKCEELAV